MSQFFYKDKEHRNEEYTQNGCHRCTEYDGDAHGNTGDEVLTLMKSKGGSSRGVTFEVSTYTENYASR